MKGKRVCFEEINQKSFFSKYFNFVNALRTYNIIWVLIIKAKAKGSRRSIFIACEYILFYLKYLTPFSIIFFTHRPSAFRLWQIAILWELCTKLLSYRARLLYQPPVVFIVLHLNKTQICISVCRDGWWAFQKTCYKVLVESIPNVEDASARCETDGAYLADIRDLKEYRFVIGTTSYALQFFFHSVVYMQTANNVI